MVVFKSGIGMLGICIYTNVNLRPQYRNDGFGPSIHHVLYMLQLITIEEYP